MKNNKMNNSMMRFACIKQLEIIGEASNHITPEIAMIGINHQPKMIL
jgi:uncharacterized protein with HEPN domain